MRKQQLLLLLFMLSLPQVTKQERGLHQQGLSVTQLLRLQCQLMQQGHGVT
jgi:hypothetical protein